MARDLGPLTPKYIDTPGVQVILGGIDTYQEEITAFNTPMQSMMEEPMAPPDMETDPHVKSLDEIMAHYQEPSEGYYTIDIPEDADMDPAENVFMYKTPREKKQKKSKKKDHKQQFVDEIWYEEPEPYNQEKEPPTVGVPFAIPEKQDKLNEHKLTRILTKKYVFGRYGSALFVRDANYVYSEVSVDTVEKLLMSTLTESQLDGFQISMARGVRKRLLASPEISANQLMFPEEKVLFKNGCYNIVTKRPAKIEDSDFFVTRINANYFPDKKLSCPYFDRYLETASGGDKSIEERICTMLGYLMLNGYPGKKILVLGTAKNSGKSMISRFYQRLVDPELVCGQSPLDMSESHALSEFIGKVANMYMDLPAIIIKPPSVGVLKMVSGGDLISINPKGRDRRSMICFTKQVLGTNYGLRLQQYDAAFWERVEVIPYIYSINPDDRIYDLEELLMLECDAIVKKCIKAARRLIKNGYRFPDCPVADKIKDSWIGWQAYAKEYLEANCIEEKDSFTPSTPLYNAYTQYCQENNIPYGTMTGFITLAKQMFPSKGNPHPMIEGVQQRGLPDVRFRGEL